MTCRIVSWQRRRRRTKGCLAGNLGVNKVSRTIKGCPAGLRGVNKVWRSRRRMTACGVGFCGVTIVSKEVSKTRAGSNWMTQALDEELWKLTEFAFMKPV